MPLNVAVVTASCAFTLDGPLANNASRIANPVQYRNLLLFNAASKVLPLSLIRRPRGFFCPNAGREIGAFYSTILVWVGIQIQ